MDEEQKVHIEAVKALIMNEVNVKDIKFVDGDAGVLVKKVKCDFKKLGPKFGKQMKAVAAAVAEILQKQGYREVQVFQDLAGKDRIVQCIV